MRLYMQTDFCYQAFASNSLFCLPDLVLLSYSGNLGETHFDAYNQPLAYFKVLCLSQQFEGALGFLARFEALRCHALHLALILRDMKILLVPANNNIQAPLGKRLKVSYKYYFFMP